MSAPDNGERGDPAGDAGRTDAPDAAREAADNQLGAMLAAGKDLLDALRRLATGLVGLLAAEARILRASVSMVFLGAVALVAVAVSLWACVVALIGWALAIATGSIGLALLLLVVLHLVLMGLLWLAIKRAIHRASFPHSRAELKALRRTLGEDVARFQRASAAPRPSSGEPPP